MLQGVYKAAKKNGTVYYRSSITCRGRHISLGSFSTETDAHNAYLEAARLLTDSSVTIDNISFSSYLLHFEKLVLLLNFRDNNMYIKNPIYLMRHYFNYYLTPTEIYKFDTDDLFYFSEHKLLRRGGHLYVNDYGMQVTILSRYGIRNYAVPGKDYTFANQDPYDLRYSNIININPYHGVRQTAKGGIITYRTSIHINGDYQIGSYQTLPEAAIAYNKATDLARSHGINKNFQTNYLAELSGDAYARLYEQVTVSEKFIRYLGTVSR